MRNKKLMRIGKWERIFATQRATSERGDETDIVSFNVKVQVDSDVLRPGMRFRLAGDAS